MKTRPLFLLLILGTIALSFSSILSAPVQPVQARLVQEPTAAPEKTEPPGLDAGVAIKTKPQHSTPLEFDALLPTAAGITNGDFESGSVGWEEYSSHGWQLIMDKTSLPVAPHSGNWAAWLGGDYNEIAYIAQSVDIPTGNAELSFWEWIASGDVCGFDLAQVRINDLILQSIDLCSDNNTQSWVRRTVDLSAYAGTTVTLQIRVETNETQNSNYFVDDVVISGTAGDQFAYLPIILKDYWSGFLDDFSLSSTKWCIEENADTKMGYIQGEYHIIIKRPNVGYMCVYDDPIPISSYVVEVDARMVSSNPGSYGLAFGLRWGTNTRQNYVVSVEPYTRYYRIQRRNMDGSWTTLVDWTYSSLINPGTQTNRLRIDRLGTNIFFSLNGIFVTLVSDSQITGSGLYTGLGVNSYNNTPVEVRFDNFKASMP